MKQTSTSVLFTVKEGQEYQVNGNTNHAVVSIAFEHEGNGLPFLPDGDTVKLRLHSECTVEEARKLVDQLNQMVDVLTYR